MFFRSIPLFTIFGFRVRLDLSWLILAFLVVSATASDAAGPPDYLRPASAVALGLFFAFGLLMSIVLHELAHSLIARRRGVAIRGITLFILGGVSEMEDEPQDPWSEFLIAIVGPLSSFVIGGACLLVGLLGIADGAALQVIYDLARLNVLLGLFNLLPAFPLDGGRVLRSILWGLKGDAMWASKIASWTGRAAGWLMIAYGIATLLSGSGRWIMLPLIGWFVLKAAPVPYRMMSMKHRLKASTVSAFVTPAAVTTVEHATLADVTALPGALSADVVPVVRGGDVVAWIDMAAVKAMTPDEQRRRSVGDLSREIDPSVTIGPSESAEEAVRRMQVLQQPVLLVMEGGNLLGVVRWDDLLKHAQGRA
jgi:Zn-dependent protease/CBS domain-containing protein